MNRRDTIIYLAGIVDGEGYVGIKKSKRPKDCVSPLYHERIQIRMIDEPCIKLFKKTFGGSYYKEKPHCDNGKPLYCYQASDLIAYKICKELFPYLIIKNRNAKIIFKLRKSKNDPRSRLRGSPSKRPMLKKIVDKREQLYLACKRR